MSPTHETFAAATQSVDWTSAPDFAVNLINLDGDGTWPIVAATFILLPKDPRNLERSRNVMAFFDWAYTHGGAVAENLEYIPLPKAVQDEVRAVWRANIKGPDGKPIF